MNPSESIPAGESAIPAVYHRLAAFLDGLPGGFPPAEDQLHVRLLQKLFSEEEAVFLQHLMLIPEPAEVLAKRANLDAEEARSILERLAARRLIYFWPGKNGSTYMVAQFVIGFWEGQVNQLDRELVELYEAYFPYYAASGNWQEHPQLRVIPIGESIHSSAAVLPYMALQSDLAQHERFAVANCICRQEAELMGKGCGKLKEACLAFDSTADLFVRDGRGRYIMRAEVEHLIRSAERSGLVLQSGNTRQPGNVCLCCGCCCGVLRVLKTHPEPASLPVSAYRVVMDREACNGCGVCLRRCPMDAFEKTAEGMVHHAQRCIGCGLCVSTCRTGALRLDAKLTPQELKIPRSTVELMLTAGWSRGKLGWREVISMAGRTLRDRVRVAFQRLPR